MRNNKITGMLNLSIEGNHEKEVALCLLPGLFDNLASLNASGFPCDEIAGSEECSVKVATDSPFGLAEFARLVRSMGASVERIIIQNRVNDYEIYDKRICFGDTASRDETKTDYVFLGNYINVNAFDRSRITVLNENDREIPLVRLTAQKFMSIQVPANANFNMFIVYRTFE